VNPSTTAAIKSFFHSRGPKPQILQASARRSHHRNKSIDSFTFLCSPVSVDQRWSSRHQGIESRSSTLPSLQSLVLFNELSFSIVLRRHHVCSSRSRSWLASHASSEATWSIWFSNCKYHRALYRKYSGKRLAIYMLTFSTTMLTRTPNSPNQCSSKNCTLISRRLPEATNLVYSTS
jgi:hypothetical protein